jgi:hypothetical protein
LDVASVCRGTGAGQTPATPADSRCGLADVRTILLTDRINRFSEELFDHYVEEGQGDKTAFSLGVRDLEERRDLTVRLLAGALLGHTAGIDARIAMVSTLPGAPAIGVLLRDAMTKQWVAEVAQDAQRRLVDQRAVKPIVSWGDALRQILDYQDGRQGHPITLAAAASEKGAAHACEGVSDGAVEGGGDEVKLLLDVLDGPPAVVAAPSPN